MLLLLCGLLCGGVLGCDDPVGLGAEEARRAVDQVARSAVGQATVVELIELATGFSLGLTPAEAAAELAGQMSAAAPCASPTAADTTISMSFGAGCEVNGHAYSGASSVTVVSDADTAVEVNHQWTGVSNGLATLDGTTAVEWSGQGQGLTRHVVHDLAWTTPEGVSVSSTGDHLQALMRPPEGIAGGLVVNGHRDWTIDGETWSATVNEIEIYGIELVPEAGSYTLVEPGGHEVEIEFEVVEGEADAISVIVSDVFGRQLLDVDRSGQPIAGE